MVWCDDRDIVLTAIHANFKLSGNGEEVGLFDQNLNLVNSLIFDELSDDISFGRKPDGSETCFYFAEPTPNNPNTSEGFLSSGQSPDVVFSLTSGFYNSSMNLSFFVRWYYPRNSIYHRWLTAYAVITIIFCPHFNRFYFSCKSQKL